MHELSIARSVLDLVEGAARREEVRRVERIRLRIGVRSAVEPEALRFCFDAVARGTVAEEAHLELETEPAQGNCRACARVSVVHEFPSPCPACAAWALDLSGGEGIRVSELEVC
jgi:hydrogenase nickel incorporation protein HypA/HybF